MKNHKLYTSCDVEKIFNIPMVTIQAWIKFEFIKPTVTYNKKRTYRFFSEEDLKLIGLFKALVDFGVNRKSIWPWLIEIKSKIQPTKNKIRQYLKFRIKNKRIENFEILGDSHSGRIESGRCLNFEFDFEKFESDFVLINYSKICFEIAQALEK